MDVALAIEKLLPEAQYGGSLTANDQKAFEALRWEDARKKPSWADLQTAWEILSLELEQQIRAASLLPELLTMFEALPLELQQKHSGDFALAKHYGEKGELDKVKSIIKGSNTSPEAEPNKDAMLEKFN